MADADIIAADDLTRTKYLPSNIQFRQLVADRCGWPCNTAVQMIREAGEGQVRLIKPSTDFPQLITREAYEAAKAAGKLDYFACWDPYARNPRLGAFASTVRNYRHNSISYELAAMVQRAGYTMDFECRRVCRLSGNSSQPVYKPDGVAALPVATVLQSQAPEEFFRDVGLRGTTSLFLIETKGIASNDQHDYNSMDDSFASSRKEGVDLKANAVVSGVRSAFPGREHRLIDQYTIIPAVVGHYNELSEALDNFVANLAMLTAIKESREEGSDTADTAEQAGETVRYARYRELRRHYTLRIQMAAGIPHAHTPAILAERSRSAIGGSGLADHAELANPKGTHMTIHQFRRHLNASARRLDIRRLRAQGAPLPETEAATRAREYLQTLHRANAEDKTRKPRAPPTCGTCGAQGHTCAARCCPRRHEYLQRRADRRPRAAQQPQDGGLTDGGAGLEQDGRGDGDDDGEEEDGRGDGEDDGRDDSSVHHLTEVLTDTI